jgi:hypothetical protein
VENASSKVQAITSSSRDVADHDSRPHPADKGRRLVASKTFLHTETTMTAPVSHQCLHGDITNGSSSTCGTATPAPMGRTSRRYSSVFCETANTTESNESYRGICNLLSVFECCMRLEGPSLERRQRVGFSMSGIWLCGYQLRCSRADCSYGVFVLAKQILLPALKPKVSRSSILPDDREAGICITTSSANRLTRHYHPSYYTSTSITNPTSHFNPIITPNNHINR